MLRLCPMLMLAMAATALAVDVKTDVAIYGATPAGVAAAVNAAREGAQVLLIEETGHVGGMTSGGLSNTDFHSFESLGGTWREFMHRVEQHYITTYGPESQQVADCVKGGYYEPKVARRVLEQMMSEAGPGRVRVVLRHRLREARPSGKRLERATFDNLAGGEAMKVTAKVFVDATYEGDLLAAAGVPYRVGCESKSEYGESLAFDEPNAWVQTYNFRVILSRDPANRIPITRPEGYNRAEYAPLIELFKTRKLQSLMNPDPKPVLKVRLIPNNKADWNDDWNVPISLSLENVNHPWPEGDAATRQKIYEIYKLHSLSLFYFLANDREVPQKVREQMAEWGLPRDEYVETGHWSPQLYVREGRRMMGRYVFTQHDAQKAEGSVRAPVQRDAVAMGDYAINCHGVYSPSFGVTVGHMGGRIRPYGVPYQVMLPRELDGLIVPVAISSSHVGFCAIRMEPTWTALGQAAGVAAAMAVRSGGDVDEVNVRKLQWRLHELGAMTVYVGDLDPAVRVARPAWETGEFTCHLLGWPPKSPYFRAAQFFGTQGFFHGFGDDAVFLKTRRTKHAGQWGPVFAEHDAELDNPIDAALARRWADQAAELGIKILPQAAPGMTRGQYLQSLLEAMPRP